MRLAVLLASAALAAASPQQGLLVGQGSANSLGSGGPPCGSTDNVEASKPQNLQVSELVSWVRITWDRPPCEGDLTSYILVILGGSTSYDTEIKCDEQQCTYDMNPAVCDYCIRPNVDYTFSVAAVLEDSQLGPAATVNQAVDVETCPNFVAPLHTTTLCRGVSEVNANGDCNNDILWSKGSMCQAKCEQGYGFFVPPAKKYSCGVGGEWSPDSTAPECYQIVPVYSANLQYKITYQRESVESLQHQFDGLVYKYNDIFCPYPEECGISDLSTKASLDKEGRPVMDVVLTIDTPVYNITDQEGFIDIVSEALSTVTEDNAFMTLIDYDNIELVLPSRQRKGRRNKAEAALCCHKCPDGHAYRLGHCVKCPTPDCN